MKVFPAMHYTMGGIWVNNEDQATSVPGIYAAGECEYQYHGANRLGANSLVSCIFGGGIAGLALTTSLRNLHPLLNCLKIVSQDTSKSLKIALIERNSLKPSTLSGAPANRCSSLTPSSVCFLQGQSPLAIVDS